MATNGGDRLGRLKELRNLLERLPPSPARDRLLDEVRSRAVDVDTGVMSRESFMLHEVEPLNEIAERLRNEAGPRAPQEPRAVPPPRAPVAARREPPPPPEEPVTWDSLDFGDDEWLLSVQEPALPEPWAPGVRPWARGLRG